MSGSTTAMSGASTLSQAMASRCQRVRSTISAGSVRNSQTTVPTMLTVATMRYAHPIGQATVPAGTNSAAASRPTPRTARIVTWAARAGSH